jgi:hypothetical protein
MPVAETIVADCPSCGRTFEQPFDPGKRRVYCSNACRQREYRARGGRASGTRQQSESARQRQEEAEAWAREQAKREQARERMRRNRGKGEEHIPTPPWCAECPSDTTTQARARRTARLLWTRAAHQGTTEHEATSCKAKAEHLRSKHGL